MELRCVYESESESESKSASDSETPADLKNKGSEVEASGSATGSGRKNGGLRENAHSLVNSVSKIVSQIKKPQYKRSGSPLNWFPRRKTDSYLKRKIRLLQKNEGMDLSLDETLGNANPHYTRIAREKIAAREAARKAMEARKAAMVEASWCRVLRAARIQNKEAEAELEKAEKCAAEAFEAARAKGVMMYDRPDTPRRSYEVESHPSLSGKSTHTVTASFETAFEVDKEVMAAIRRAFIQLANGPHSSNKEEFKDLLWKINQNPDNNEASLDFSETHSESELDADLSGDDAVNIQDTEKKQKRSNCSQFDNGHDKSTAEKFIELVTVMLDRLKGLEEDELASLATIVATCGLNAALIELEHSKDHELNGFSCTNKHGTGERRNSSVARFMDGYSNRKEPVTEVPSLDKFLVKHVSRLEREVQEARNSRSQQTTGASEPINAEPKKFTSSEHVSDFGSVLVKHVSKLEKEIQEARKSRNNSSYQDKENIDSNTLVSSSDTNGTQFGTEMEKSPVKHLSRLERAKLEVLATFSSHEQSSLDKILVKPVHRLEREKIQALERETEYLKKRDNQKQKADARVSESLDKVLVKHISKLEKEKMVSGKDYGPTTTVKRRDTQQLEKTGSLDEILVKHQSKLEKVKLAASQQPVYDIVKNKKHGTEATEDSLDKILVRHQPELEKAKLAAAQQSDDYTKYADSRKEARERELQEAWGGLSLGNSIRPHLSRLERDRAAWKRAEEEERMLAREAMK
ncbi:uncharacterized protein A4U43_C03F21500 [Asparagus officinalis]|uniref:Uncharacterized protein n=1 Tax=Asparagus officinalis TaxID=4686 RepID=A0A5P1FBY0_ASPOF|nr:uncharacterized protein LOC109834170 [Asparagus officinalis]ONK75875.1 uncharacterized protein A4U43_C03F21500 [Asparagus officinalis]